MQNYFSLAGNQTANSATGPCPTGSYQILHGRRSPTAIAAGAAGTWAADVAITAFSSVPVPLILGAQVAGGGTEPFVGWINEIRIYAETHDDTQSAAVITEMSA